MTDELLKGLATQAANMAKTEIRYRHQLNGILAIYHEGQGLHRLRKIEQEVEEKCGKAWLDSGRAKDILFGVLATGAKALPPDAIVIATGGDRFEPTAALLALSPEDQMRIRDAHHPRELPQYFQPHDVLMVLVQTPDRVCIYTQRLGPRGMLLGEPEIKCGPQSAFDGRLKMFGVEPPAEIVETLTKMIAKKNFAGNRPN